MVRGFDGAKVGAVALLTALLSIAAVAQSWRTPRTPWGDPDLTGTYVNDNEYATPLERPESFAGRRREDVRPDEYQARARDQAVAGLAPGPRGPDDWWLSNLDLARRKAYTSRTFGMSSLAFGARSAAGMPLEGQRQLVDAIALGGGLPIVAGMDRIGGIGVSGATSQEADEKCAQAGIAAAANQLR